MSTEQRICNGNEFECVTVIVTVSIANWEQVLRSTGHSSTIRIEENDFDEYKSCNLRLGFSSTWKEQLSKME